MHLGTLDRTPPPFFRQGPSALTKLVFFSALAMFMMVSDTRFGFIGPIRSTLATVMLPLQNSLAVPVRLWGDARAYMGGLQTALTAERAARAALVRQADRAAAAEQLQAENARLRALLELRPSLTVRSQAAEVMYEAADPYSRKVVIDRGSTHGIVRGSPVINDTGLLGQVTRVYPLNSEVTLLTDRDAAIPVLNTRTQQRSAASGGAGGGSNPGMELRFMAGNADVQVGDSLVTSGIDGIYPAGLPVARVVHVERRADSGFARIQLVPAAPPDAVRHVMVLEPLAAQLPPRTDAAPAVTTPPTRALLR
jgi:rod shape-determining protein MreC